ncbi:hypothetical protein FO519_004053 [Halicephalobus sp. NKZ332]|nr:hypothetical protein FO519_004053 [Halicephalobus sp. NKZ332]
MRIIFFVYFVAELIFVKGLFFGGSGCQCCQSCPVQTCAPSYNPCPPVSYNSYPSQDCCSTCSSPCRVRQVLHRRRQKRQDELEELPDESFFTNPDEFQSKFNPKCNSERLKKIILMSAGIEISVTKRNIQLLAEKHFHEKFNVICTLNGDFSYITSTEEFCQEEINGKTCYVFKHLNRSLSGLEHSVRKKY